MRSFNRTVTARLGVLNDHFLGRERPLGEARLLWEIGIEGADVRDLRGRLAVDSAYLSRTLRSLERQGLSPSTASPSDGRVRRAHLSEAGIAERAELDRRSDRFAVSLLGPLPEARRAKLASAMGEVERLLVESMLSIGVEDATSPDAKWCLAQYYAELGRRFESGFDHALSISAEAHELTPPAGAVLVARLGDEPVGCGALKLHGDVRRSSSACGWPRGCAGSGWAGACCTSSSAAPPRRGRGARLETNRSLTEAIALYRRSGNPR